VWVYSTTPFSVLKAVIHDFSQTERTSMRAFFQGRGFAPRSATTGEFTDDLSAQS